MNYIYSTTQAARILNISRVAVFKMIQTGKLKAIKTSRNYSIDRESLIMVVCDQYLRKDHRQWLDCLKSLEQQVKKTLRDSLTLALRD